MNFKNWLNEATRKYVEKVVDPALLTQSEYYKLVNPRDAYHDSSAYQTSLEDNQYRKKEDFPKLLNTKIINGIKFEFRLQIEDKVNWNVAKTDKEGNSLKGPDGGLVYLTEKEKIDRYKGLDNNKRYNYSVGVFTEEGWVGGSQDEWGAMLIMVVHEYKKFGLGTEIGKIARSFHPDKDSGGFTPDGYRMFQRVHSEYVREYMNSGMYSHLVKTKQLSAERAKEIIDSINPRSKKTQKNLNSNDPNDWLLFADGDCFILYDKKLKDVIDDEDHFFKEKMIKGTILARESSDIYRIIYFGGETQEIKKQMITLSAMRAAYYKLPLAVELEDSIFIDTSKIKIIERDTVKPGFKSHLVYYQGPIVNTENLGQKEKQFRNKFDKYEEFSVKMQELAYGKYR